MGIEMEKIKLQACMNVKTNPTITCNQSAPKFFLKILPILVSVHPTEPETGEDDTLLQSAYAQNTRLFHQQRERGKFKPVSPSITYMKIIKEKY